MAIWDDVVAPAPRPVVIRSPHPADEARAILMALLSGRGRSIPSRTSRGIRILGGEVDGARVSFSAVPRTDQEADPANEPPRLEFSGFLDEDADGSVLTGSITTPLTLVVPALGLGLLVTLFLLWGGIPLPLVAIGAVAWGFLTLIVLASLREQRLGEADTIRRWLEDALA